MSTVKNILLVYPEVPTNTYWSFKYALKFLKKKSAMPPLGLITLAALFPENYNLRLIDMNIEPLNEKDIQWADAVFVSAMIIQKESLKKVIADCNRLKTPVVSGGPYATSSYQEIDGVDHFVLGEVEDTFKNFLQDLEKGNAKKIYRQPERPDITSTVTPRFDLLDMNAYSSMSIQYSRGCPFKCEFCDIWKVYGNKPRVKSAETVIRELDVLYQSGWEGPVFMVDDNFIGNKKHVKKELLPVIIEWQIKHSHIFRFTTEASINIADDNELLAQMRDAGFNQVFIGIETPSTEALKETGKFQNLKIDMVEAIQTVQEYSIEVMAGFIIGFDTDKEDIFDRQISFIQQTGIPQAMVGLLNAL
ncbi:MAG: B12-binding domain-containing radical SAM protein, partial [Deltaproteobacteria bacterium]|nr:B12-binding domain-containing radical SAM protein [Deltaproteobacteria bacterium]